MSAPLQPLPDEVAQAEALIALAEETAELPEAAGNEAAVDAKASGTCAVK